MLISAHKTASVDHGPAGPRSHLVRRHGGGPRSARSTEALWITFRSREYNVTPGGVFSQTGNRSASDLHGCRTTYPQTSMHKPFEKGGCRIR